MTRRAFILILTLAFSFFPFSGASANAQRKSAVQTPEQKPRKVKVEPNKAFKEWPDNDVALIMLEGERRAYERLQTDEEREQFIDTFWRMRDPSPDTEENEYRQEYYERMAYADEHFSSGKPGRLTDRGRVYIKFGKPDSIESHPSGGSYERMSYEGGGSTTTYPFERWYYRRLQDRTGVEIEFVDQTGSGEYRIARNPYEKEATLYIPGSSPTFAELLGFGTQADRVAAANGYGQANYLRSQNSMFEVLGLLKDLQSPPEFKPNYFAGDITGTPKIDDNPLAFNIQVHVFRQSENHVLTAFTIQTDNKDLTFTESGGLQVARLNINGTIWTISGRRVSGFQDVVSTTMTPAELVEAVERRSAYGKALVLEPGRYKVDLLVRDVVSGATGFKRYGFDVPKFDHGLAVSSVVLAARLESLTGEPAERQFVIGHAKVVPNLSGDYHQGQPVGVYLQVYNVGIDQTTLQPAVEVEYALLKEGREISKLTEDWKGTADHDPRLTLNRLIDTTNLSPGEYEVVVRIADQVTGERLSPSASFRIIR